MNSDIKIPEYIIIFIVNSKKTFLKYHNNFSQTAIMTFPNSRFSQTGWDGIDNDK